jgi:hypothetical protein
MGLASCVGWWNGVVVGDFDGDGRLDIAASNWGLNGGAAGYDRPSLVADSASQPRPGVPLVFWGDFGGGLGMDIIEAEFDAELGKVVPTRSKPAMEIGLPLIQQRFQTYDAYNHAAVAELLADAIKSASTLSAPWLASTVFLNRNGKFEPVVLPREAQFSPAFGISVADFDGDGTEDLFVAQNFFAVQPQAIRGDAGRGVLLRGDGHGKFESVPGQLSGITVYGEGRGTAVCDFDEDGRADLAVGQNGGQTRLFHNIGGRAGLRVRVNGPSANADGIGTQLRLLFGAQQGPLREIHAGTGYWSEDAAVQVLATPQKVTGIWVRWPGGATNVFELPSDTAAISVSRDGVKKVKEVK